MTVAEPLAKSSIAAGPDKVYPDELSMVELFAITGFTQSAIEMRLKHSNFPRPDRINERRVRLWKKRSILAWLYANDQEIGARYRAYRQGIVDLESDLGIK